MDRMTNTDTAFAEAQARIDATIEAATSRALKRIDSPTPTEVVETYQDIARAVTKTIVPAFERLLATIGRVADAIATLMGRRC